MSLALASNLALPSKATIAEAIATRETWALQHLQNFVAYPSVLGNEQSAQDYVAGMYEEIGFKPERLAVDIDHIKNLRGFSPVDWDYQGRYNVAAVHDVKNPAGRSLIFNGHVDVVSPEPVKLWSRDPFDAHIVQEGGDTWMYGRGAGDMKGGTVCYIWALQALRDMGLTPASRVVLQSPIEEECTGNGALSLLAAGYTGDACLIPEPFNETILCNQLGVIWFQVRIVGKTTHVLGAGAGVNAIEKSWVVIQALREIEREKNDPKRFPVAYRNTVNPLNLNVGTIEGGDWASTVAGECVTRFRFALFPGESLDELKVEIERRVAEAAAQDSWLKDFPPQVEYVGFQAEGCSFDDAGDFGQTLKSAHVSWRGSAPAKLHATCTTDVRFFNLYYNIPATCYGPKAENIHGTDERVSVSSMRRVTEVMTSLIIDWSGAQKL